MEYPLFTTKLKHTGVFDLKDAYRVAYEWLMDEGYELEETSYVEIVTSAKEVQIFWEAKDKISDYFRFKLKIKFHMLGMTNVEIEKDGIKLKKNQGQFEFHVSGILERDWQNKWTDKSAFLRKMYDKFLIKERIEKYEEKLIGDVDDLVAYMKAYLNLSTI